jgi:hypothetical protein
LPGFLGALHHGTHDAADAGLQHPLDRLVIARMETSQRGYRMSPCHEVEHRQLVGRDVEMLQVKPQRLEQAAAADKVHQPRCGVVSQHITMFRPPGPDAGEKLVGFQ